MRLIKQLRTEYDRQLQAQLSAVRSVGQAEARRANVMLLQCCYSDHDAATVLLLQ
jgi:hypothetical protein